MKSYKLVANPIAGGGKTKVLLPQVERFFKNSGAKYDLYLTRGPGDAIGAAAAAAKEGFDIVVAVGGDGTVNEVLNGIVGTKAVLAAFPGGKGNDFATAVNMPADPETAVKALLAARIKAIDLGRVMERYFINSVGVGFDAAVAERVNRGVKPFKGTSAYIYTFFEKVFFYKPVEMEIDLGEGFYQATPLLVAVGIGQAYGGGMKVVPDAVLDDGLFDVCIMEKMNPFKLIYHFPKVFSGTLKNIDQAGMHRTKEIKLKLSESRPLHLEGEVLHGDYMHFTLKPKGMKVLFGQ